MEAWIACDNSTWPASKYRLCKCHQRYIPCSTEVHPVVHPKVQHRGTSSPVQKGYLWWNLCTLYLLVCQVELPQEVQVSVVVSNVCQGLLLPFVDSNFDFENLLRSHHTTLVACVHEFYVGADYDHVPLVEFMYPVVACMPGGVTAGSSGLCCCLFSIEHNYFPLLIQIFTLKFSLVYTTQLLSPVCRSSTLAQTMNQKIRSDSKHSPLNRSVCFTSVAACHWTGVFAAPLSVIDQVSVCLSVIEQVSLLYLSVCLSLIRSLRHLSVCLSVCLSLNRSLCCTSLSACHWTGVFAAPLCLSAYHWSGLCCTSLPVFCLWTGVFAAPLCLSACHWLDLFAVSLSLSACHWTDLFAAPLCLSSWLVLIVGKRES